jgi:hypothetical protein
MARAFRHPQGMYAGQEKLPAYFLSVRS